jgi:hypothetical protein
MAILGILERRLTVFRSVKHEHLVGAEDFHPSLVEDGVESIGKNQFDRILCSVNSEGAHSTLESYKQGVDQTLNFVNCGRGGVSLPSMVPWPSFCLTSSRKSPKFFKVTFNFLEFLDEI